MYDTSTLNVILLAVSVCELLVARMMFFNEAVPPFASLAAVSDSLMISPLVPLIGVRANEVLVRR